ncbi:hypothetical protein ACFSM5_05050 [Lacibacterium aquatile]|uniref:Uncharacterized protein n=1 Tax=Lacibacterium aquatile TaxID=1168082 RepID=A0ABW5DNY6_9PROT
MEETDETIVTFLSGYQPRAFMLPVPQNAAYPSGCILSAFYLLYGIEINRNGCNNSLPMSLNRRARACQARTPNRNPQSMLQRLIEMFYRSMGRLY